MSDDGTTRKPVVAFGSSLEGDLTRRDFTVNAMALRLPSLEFVDLHGGLDDLAARVLRTPVEPEVSFGDDPLRMMRAARFVAQLGFSVDPSVRAAMTSWRGRWRSSRRSGSATSSQDVARAIAAGRADPAGRDRVGGDLPAELPALQAGGGRAPSAQGCVRALAAGPGAGDRAGVWRVWRIGRV